MKRTFALAIAMAALVSPLSPSPAQAGIDPVADASEAITILDLDRARTLLNGLDPESPQVALELGRLALYSGDCDLAAKYLANPKVQALKEGPMHLDVARGCMRGMAGTVTVKDDLHQTIVRFQDDADSALASLIGETVAKQREVLKRDLGVDMPLPTRIDVVRDQTTLSAMTGLPLAAAQKTGTVAIAKFGRVVLISPRAPTLGYTWRDTVAHELTHLALSRGSIDHAPLWLQEGVAKREETRWRAPLPTDEAVSPDALAAAGITRKLALPLDKLGPSLALLPSAEQAMVCYAEVQSFVRFAMGDRAGEPGASTDKETLQKLLKAYARGLETDPALKEVTGKTLGEWDAVWRPWVEKKATKLPDALGLDPPKSQEAAKAAAKAQHDAQRALRLGELLVGRGHAKAARTLLDPLAPTHKDDPVVTAWAARARLFDGDAAGALSILDPKGVTGDLGFWWAARGDALRSTAAPASDVVTVYGIAIAHDPFSIEAACGWADLPAGAPPFDGWLDAAAKGLCSAARARQLPKMGQD